jgi:hypothetical protein
VPLGNPQPPRYGAADMRGAWGLVFLVGCARPPGPAPAAVNDGREVEVKSLRDDLDEPTLATLRAHIAAHTPVYWRLRGPDGPRCEPWSFTPDPDDPERGSLAHIDGPLRFQFRYQLSGGRLQLHAPERERELTAVPGAVGVTAVALPCVFSGMSFTPDSPVAARRLVLAGHERWFTDAATCEAAGPDLDPQPRAPGEFHPLGCASALADSGTRARDDQPAPVTPAAARLAHSKRVYWLRRRAGRPVCEAWHHEPAAEPQRGTLRHHDRDAAGPHTRAYGYATAGPTLTLLGPNEFRRLRDRDSTGELARARGCLITRPLRLHGDVLQFGDDRWYLRRAACEQARRSGLAPEPDPDCGAASQ